jgi:hypothetical protein
MQNNSVFVEFDAFNESSASNALRSLLVGGQGQGEGVLEQCIKNFPHAGSDKSVASKLPFPTVSVCKTDTVGIVRLVGLFDNIVPDITTLRFHKSGIWYRVLTIQVPLCSTTRIFMLTTDICTQACVFWLFILFVTLLNITSCIQSTLWLSHQSSPTFLGSGVQWSYLTRLCALWATQQFANLLLMPMLNLRKFNGDAGQR